MKPALIAFSVVLALSSVFPLKTAAAADSTAPLSAKAAAVSVASTGFESELWVANELVFTASAGYADPFDDVTLDMVLTNTSDGVILTVPGFWDGGGTWRVRFTLTSEGVWTYRTVCSNESDTGLHNRTGAVNAVPYTGELDIYKHGFVTANEGKRFFTYADGTPFFYLGDTHWGMASEELDGAGEHAGGTAVESHFKYIVDTRVRQGFTVYQSEPIGAVYDLTDGVGQNDVAGFDYLDKQFAYIASAGLVHANACFFYPATMTGAAFADMAYLQKLTRYWVARYSAYPVLWTLGQEVDNDFYEMFDTENNPYKSVGVYIHTYDAYRHPLSAHQEHTGATKASNSAFKDVAGHNWFAAQWSPKLNGQLDFGVPRDYWENGDGKIAVNYEGRYDYLWTKHFGARAQGWTAYLNGLYGYGYGCADIWLYKSTYDMDTVSDDGIDTVTPEDKAVLWPQSLEFETAYQLGAMRKFLEENEWWNLTPRFDGSQWFSGDTLFNFMVKVTEIFKGSGSLLEKMSALLQIGSLTPYFSLATDGNSRYVIYFYNQSTDTGVVNNMDRAARYTARWFNPRTGEYEGEVRDVAPNLFGSYRPGGKPDSGDWVLLLEKQA